MPTSPAIRNAKAARRLRRLRFALEVDELMRRDGVTQVHAFGVLNRDSPTFKSYNAFTQWKHDERDRSARDDARRPAVDPEVAAVFSEHEPAAEKNATPGAGLRYFRSLAPDGSHGDIRQAERSDERRIVKGLLNAVYDHGSGKVRDPGLLHRIVNDYVRRSGR